MLSKSEKWIQTINRGIQLLEKSGLWKDKLEYLKFVKEIGYNTLEKARKLYFGKFSKDYYKNEDIKKQKIKELDKRLLTKSGYLDVEIILNYSIPLKIKRMYFGKQSNKKNLKLIAEALENKKKLGVSGTTGYNVSFYYDPKGSKAFYDEQCKVSEKVHYYIVLNKKYAMFIGDAR